MQVTQEINIATILYIHALKNYHWLVRAGMYGWRGRHYSVEGPHQVEPSPYRVPVICQAGSSDPGIELAGKNAEGCFLISGSSAAAKKKVDLIIVAAARAGRNPNDIHFLEGITVIMGETMEEAVAKAAHLDSQLSVAAFILQYGGAAGINLSISSKHVTRGSG